MSDIKPWKTLQSDIVYENDLFKIKKDICQMPDGVIQQNYFVREGKDGVVVFCVAKSGEIVLVRQYRQGSQEITLELPGGFAERHDINPTEGARRELLEETGYSSEIMDTLAVWSLNAADTTMKMHLFFSSEAEKVAAPQYVAGEVTEVVLASPAEVLNMLEKGEISSVPHVAGVYRGLIKLGVIKP